MTGFVNGSGTGAFMSSKTDANRGGRTFQRGLFRRLQPGRRQPFLKMGGGFGLSRHSNELLAFEAVRGLFRFLTQARRLVFQALIRWDCLFEASSLHDALLFRIRQRRERDWRSHRRWMP